MLNEILEYEQYTAPFDVSSFAKIKHRLKYDRLNDHLSGLERPLEIIAAAEIAKLCGSTGGFDPIKDLPAVKKRLEEWYQNWFFPYVACISKEKNNTVIMNSARDKQLYLKFHMFTKQNNVSSDSKSTYNQITYERAIANALETWGVDGLRRYYLVCDDELLCKERLSAENSKHTRTNAQDTVFDTVAKLTAAFLLKKRILPENSEIRLNQADVFNWMAKGQYFQYLCSTTYFMEPGHLQIFSKPSVSNKKQYIVKYSVCDEWLRHFAVIEESELDGWLKSQAGNPKACYYSDFGAEELFGENERY